MASQEFVAAENLGQRIINAHESTESKFNQEELRHMFALFDTDHSGTISVDEITHMLKTQLGDQINLEEGKAIVKVCRATVDVFIANNCSSICLVFYRTFWVYSLSIGTGVCIGIGVGIEVIITSGIVVGVDTSIDIAIESAIAIGADVTMEMCACACTGIATRACVCTSIATRDVRGSLAGRGRHVGS